MSNKNYHFFWILSVSMLAMVPCRVSATNGKNVRDNSRFPISPAPLTFIENKGQIADQYHQDRSDIQFVVSPASGLNIFIGDGAVHYQFSAIKENSVEENTHPLPQNKFHSSMALKGMPVYSISRMDVVLIGANKKAKMSPEEPGEYQVYYCASDKSPSGTTAHSYSRITYKNIYPHIDWVLYANAIGLKQEFVVRKGGNIKNIKIRYSGYDDMKLDANGSLVTACSGGAITEHAPYSYEQNGKKIKSCFRLNNDVLSFDVEKYDGTLVIDPELLWSTYYGGSNDDQGACVGIDNSGNIYMAGNTSSISAIATSGAFQTTFGGGTYDAFLVKFTSSGTRLWATYYGGTGDEAITGIALDATGNVYATGFTTTLSGLATPGAFQIANGGSYDAFLAKFSSSGALKWSTYYGGSNKEFAYSVATDRSGNVYMGGQSNSTTGIASVGAYQDTIGDGTGSAEDAFIAKFDSVGTRIWATYYGSVDYDFGNSVAVDTAGNVYLAGLTNSPSGLATPGAFQMANAGGMYDAFLAKFTGTGALLWGTYYGGSDDDQANSLVADARGNIYMAGYTKSTSGIASPGAYQSTNMGSYDGFLAKFSSSGSMLWGTYYGGFSDDYAYAATKDDSDNIFIAGKTSSLSSISTSGAWQPAYGGGAYDAYVAKFDSLGVQKWGTYFGGNEADEGYGVVADNSGDIYLTGGTLSLSNIASAGAYQSVFGGGTSYGDAFIAKLQPGGSLGINSISKQGQSSIHLYPNPATTTFSIDVADDGVLTICSADGSLVGSYKLAKGITEIQLPTHLTAGIYSCSYKCANSPIQTVKLLVETR